MNALRPGSRPALRLGTRAGTVVVMAILAAVIIAMAWMTNGGDSGAVAADGIVPPPQVGQLAPDFQAFTVDGKQVKLSDFRGKPVWLTFGATWCIDCRAEAVDLEAAYEQNKAQGLNVVAVFKYEDVQAVSNYAGHVGFTFTMIPDPNGTLFFLYHNLGLPTHFFIGPDGVIRQTRLGRLLPDDMKQLVASVMQ
jgi:cytochrome c biogenesis protein CcmG/thiol:disulfide interchange protein DsbE